MKRIVHSPNFTEIDYSQTLIYCVLCGKSWLLAIYPKREYCSDKCKQKAYRQRKKALRLQHKSNGGDL